jgi:Tol biopolymer transport system component
MKVIDKQTLQRSRMLVCNLRETPSRWSTLAALMVIAAYQWAALPVVTHAFQGDPEQDITETDPKAAAKQETLLLANARQLTFEGRRAGEGYFSADGSQLVFQSERQQGNPFFQIYVMDLETGDLERVSPGHGKTTCAWIHPTGKHVLFASTHDDKASQQLQKEEYAMRESGQERRYSWDYDEHFELYRLDKASGKYRNLTQTPGYDAEASWSPDGKLIAFTSNRLAYQKPMTAEEKKNFAIDPAYMNDIFIMNADGSNVRQLTAVHGYDGGPFFSPDGKRICWRRFTPNGAIAEVWTMNIDGSDQRQLTRLGAMSWAPFYHPSGEYLIFTTNRHGFANFELYLIDAEAKSTPVRVSYTKGFDGLPAFTPDGKRLAWTTNRTPSKRSQIFIANWDHERARKLLGLDDANRVASTPGADAASAIGRSTREQTAAGFSAADIIRHVGFLCREELQGRLTGTPGEKLATAYVAAYLDSLGLKPAGDKGTFFQEFEFTSGVALGKKNALVSGKKEYQLNKDWKPLSFSGEGDFKPADVVFAGYGMQARKTKQFDEYDSYVHLDVKGKWVVVFRYMPENVTPERRQQLSRASQLRFKATVARDKGARGLIIVTGPNAKANSQLVPLRLDGILAGSSLPVISVTDAVAQSWLDASGKKGLKVLQDKLDTGSLAMGFALKGVQLAAQVEVNRVKGRGRNVLARLQSAEKPSDQVIVVGAHVDHLGKGASSSSLARDDESQQIHFGADDNASGVAAVLEIAEYLSSRKADGKLKLRRDVLFAAWSGEELGLLGSDHFVKSYGQHAHHAQAATATANNKPTTGPASGPQTSSATDAATAPAKGEPKKKPGEEKKPADNPHGAEHRRSIYPAVAACINMDMVGRLDKSVVLQGIGSSSIWRSELERRNAPVGLSITLQEDSYLPTDAKSFYSYGVPVLSAFTGSHSEYHTPRDTPDTLNYEGAASIARLMGLVTRSLAMRESPPDYLEQAAPQERTGGALRAYLGTIPDYAEEVKGVLLSGARKGAPAAKAGIKAGDIIVGLAGKKIENIYDYTQAISALKIGEETKIVVQRGKKKITLKITPGSRD